MVDLDIRRRRTFGRMAANESLEDVLDQQTAATILEWGDGIASQFVLKTKAMDDITASEFLAPYSSALRKMMRAMGRWVVEKDPDVRLESWNLIEQNGKTLFGDPFMLPKMETILDQLPTEAGVQQKISFIRNLIENLKAKA